MAKKGSNEYSTVFLLEGENVKLQICVWLHLCHGVLLRTQWAHGWSLQNLATVLMPNIAELEKCLLVSFFIPSHGFCGGPNTLSQEKHLRVYLDRAVMDINSWRMSIKINTKFKSLYCYSSLAQWTSHVALT